MTPQYNYFTSFEHICQFYFIKKGCSRRNSLSHFILFYAEDVVVDRLIALDIGDVDLIGELVLEHFDRLGSFFLRYALAGDQRHKGHFSVDHGLRQLVQRSVGSGRGNGQLAVVETDDLALFDPSRAELGITRRESNLTGSDILRRLHHVLDVSINVAVGIEYQHRGQALRDGTGRNDNDLSVVDKIDGLLGSHDDILVVGKNKYLLRGSSKNCREDVISGGVHALTAGNDVQTTQLVEEIAQSFACRYCDKTEILGRLCDNGLTLLLDLRLRLFVVFLCLLVLLLHVFDLHSQERAVCQTALQRVAGLLGMYMDFDDLIVGNQNDAVADGFEEQNSVQ